MQMKWGFLPSSPKGRALAFLRVRTALRISATVSLSAAVISPRPDLPFAYCTLVPAFMASRVTHSTTVPSCSPSSSALSEMTWS